MTVTPRTGSVAEAATEHGVSESTIRLWIRQGRLPAKRIGRRRYEVNLDLASTDPHIAFTRALQAVADSDLAELRSLIARIDTAVDGSSALFAYAWAAIGAVARRTPEAKAGAHV